MGGSGHHDQMVLAAEERLSLAVEVEHHLVATPHDEQGRSANLGEARAGEVRTTTPGNHSGDVAIQLSCGPQGRTSAGAGAEVADGQMSHIRLGAQPAADVDQAAGQHRDAVSYTHL